MLVHRNPPGRHMPKDDGIIAVSVVNGTQKPVYSYVYVRINYHGMSYSWNYYDNPVMAALFSRIVHRAVRHSKFWMRPICSAHYVGWDAYRTISPERSNN